MRRSLAEMGPPLVRVQISAQEGSEAVALYGEILAGVSRLHMNPKREHYSYSQVVNERNENREMLQ
jgi:hypothetical protein